MLIGYDCVCVCVCCVLCVCVCARARVCECVFVHAQCTDTGHTNSLSGMQYASTIIPPLLYDHWVYLGPSLCFNCCTGSWHTLCLLMDHITCIVRDQYNFLNTGGHFVRPTVKMSDPQGVMSGSYVWFDFLFPPPAYLLYVYNLGILRVWVYFLSIFTYRINAKKLL